MKSVNHAAARRRAAELQTKPAQFSAVPTRGSAGSKLLRINLFPAVLVTLIVPRHIESTGRDEEGPQ